MPVKLEMDAGLYERLCPGIRIRPLDGTRDWVRCADLQKEIWGYPDSAEVVPGSFLAITPHIGGLLLGAYAGRNRLVGFAWAVPAFHEGRRTYHSHMLGILPAFRRRNIGWALKMVQRDLALARGIHEIHWTFDPLQSGNARFNLCRLGASVRAYVRDFYGRSDSPLHSAIPTDRFIATWSLTAARVVRYRAQMLAEAPPTGRLPDRWDPVLAAESRRRADRPQRIHLGNEYLFEVPENLEMLKKENLRAARRWQTLLRLACIDFFAKGYRIDSKITPVPRLVAL